MRSSRPTGAVQKEFARPRERRGEGHPALREQSRKNLPDRGNGGVRAPRPTGAVQKEFARPRERRDEVIPPYGSSPERICPTEGTAGCRDVTPSIRSKSENRGTRPRFSGICKANSIKYVRKAHEKRHARRRAFCVSAHKCAETLSPAVFRLCRNRQGRRTAVRRIKFPVKVGACT